MKPKRTPDEESAAMTLIMDLSARQACLEDDSGIAGTEYSRSVSYTAPPLFEDGVFKPACGALVDITISPTQRFPCKFSMIVTATSSEKFFVNVYSRGTRDTFQSIALAKDATTGRWIFEDKYYQAIELALCSPT